MRNKRLIILISILSFITVLIVASSVLFSVKGVYASCYNTEDSTLDMQIATEEVSGIKKGRSIFLLKEKEVIASVEKNVKDVKVINVERKFPNRIYINYVKIYPYFVVENESAVSYVANDGKIISSGEKQTSYADNILYISGANSSVTLGELVFTKGTKEAELFAVINEALERVAKHSVAIQTFEKVDATKTISDGKTYFITRTGTCFELQGGKSNMIKKLRLAISVYSSNETAYMNGGTIIINSSGTKAHYTKDNRYLLDTEQV